MNSRIIKNIINISKTRVEVQNQLLSKRRLFIGKSEKKRTSTKYTAQILKLQLIQILILTFVIGIGQYGSRALDLVGQGIYTKRAGIQILWNLFSQRQVLLNLNKGISFYGIEAVQLAYDSRVVHASLDAHLLNLIKHQKQYYVQENILIGQISIPVSVDLQGGVVSQNHLNYVIYKVKDQLQAFLVMKLLLQKMGEGLKKWIDESK